MTRQEQFEYWWKQYPRKVAKGNARKAFEKALKNASADEIIQGLMSQLTYYSSLDSQFIPHPATWLNGERWSDEPQQPRQNNRKRTLADAAIDYWGSHGHADGPWNGEQCGPTGFAPSLFDGNRRH